MVWRVVLALAAVKPNEVKVVTLHLQFCLGLLLRLLHRDEQDTSALHLPLTFLVLHPVISLVVVLIDSGGRAPTISLGPHHLRLAPEKTILGVHLLHLHLKHRFFSRQQCECCSRGNPLS